MMKSLSKDPAKRFQTGQAMAAALRNCLVPGNHPFPETDGPIEKAGRSRRMIPVIALIGLVLAAGVFGYSVMHKPENPPARENKASNSVPASILNVNSNPLGAQVFVDSVFKGITPLDIPLAPGSHEVRLNLPGYYEWEAQLQIDEADPAPLNVRLVSIN